MTRCNVFKRLYPFCPRSSQSLYRKGRATCIDCEGWAGFKDQSGKKESLGDRRGASRSIAIGSWRTGSLKNFELTAAKEATEYVHGICPDVLAPRVLIYFSSEPRFVKASNEQGLRTRLGNGRPGKLKNGQLQRGVHGPAMVDRARSKSIYQPRRQGRLKGINTVVLGPSGFVVGEPPASQAATAVNVARSAAEALLGDLERAAKSSADWADQSLGFALVQNAMDRCLNKLACTRCWGRSNQMPSNEFWAVAGSWLQLGSLQDRARNKPRGYAGDYEMFVQFFEGYCVDHPLGRLFDRYFQSQVAVEAVRSRTQQIAAALTARCLAAEGGKPFRIVSVGCGPGLDVELALRWLPAEKRNQVHIALLDLDEDAVEHACSRINGLLPTAQVVGQRDNLYRLATKPKTLTLLDGADFLVCSGLFDYLPDAAATSLLRAFWQSLSHRGVLLVGNFAPHNPTRAYMEWLGNWYLTYRTPNELWELAEQAAIPQACISVGAERLGVDLFVCADKAI